jgi:hypothetical protein
MFFASKIAYFLDCNQHLRRPTQAMALQEKYFAKIGPSLNPITPLSKPPRKSRVRRFLLGIRDWVQHPTAKRFVAVGSVVTVIAGLVGTVGNLERVPVYLCHVPGIHALCGRLEIGEVAGKAEQDAWKAAQEATDARALRAYLVAFPTGVYASEASTRLAACRSVQREVWTAEKRALPLYVTASTATAASLLAARETALARGQKDAAGLCAGFAGEFKLRSSAAQVTEWLCHERSDGASCGFEGTAQCDVEARRLISEETCR